MDSVTHMAIGACLGEAFAGKQLGKKAWVWGAVAHTLPDADVVTVLWMDTPHGLLAHRGITHSLLAAAVFSVLLAWLAWRRNAEAPYSYRQWLVFLGMAVLLHPLLDVFNNYGVAWQAPFSEHRFSVDALYVADPFFTLGPLTASIAMLLSRRARQRRWWRWGLGWSAFYLLFSLAFKYKIEADMAAAITAQRLDAPLRLSTPAPLQNLLWFTVAGNDRGFYVGYRSLFDRSSDIDWTFFPRNDSLLRAGGYAQESLDLLRQFSRGFYTVEMRADTLVFNDLRFGQELGWQNSQGRFAFHYWLNYPDANRTVVQRGRFAGWDAEAAQALLERIVGEKPPPHR